MDKIKKFGWIVLYLTLVIFSINYKDILEYIRGDNSTSSTPSSYHFIHESPEIKYPVKRSLSNGWNVKDEYFGIGEKVDYMFEPLPNEIVIIYHNQSYHPGSADKIALTQLTSTTLYKNINLHAEWREYVRFVLVIAGFIMVMILAYSILQTTNFDQTLYLLKRFGKYQFPILLTFIGCFYLLSSNTVIFDNASSYDRFVDLCDARLKIPPKRHIKVTLDCGLQFLTISNSRGESFLSSKIKVIRSDPLVFNIEKLNVYNFEEGTYKKNSQSN